MLWLCSCSDINLSPTTHQGSSVLTRGNDQYSTLLHSAVITGRTRLADTLVEQGASMDIPDYRGWTPRDYLNHQLRMGIDPSKLHVSSAAADSSVELQVSISTAAKNLQRCTGIVDSETGMTMLHVSAVFGLAILYQGLIDGGINQEIPDKRGFTAAAYAQAMNQRTLVIKDLIWPAKKAAINIAAECLKNQTCAMEETKERNKDEMAAAWALADMFLRGNTAMW